MVIIKLRLCQNSHFGIKREPVNIYSKGLISSWDLSYVLGDLPQALQLRRGPTTCLPGPSSLSQGSVFFPALSSSLLWSAQYFQDCIV